MPQIRLLAPVSHEGKDFKVDDVISVDEMTAQGWRAQGKAQLMADEIASAASAGHYSDVMGREEIVEPQEEAHDPIPPARKKGSK